MAETYVSPTYGCGGCTIRWKGVSERVMWETDGIWRSVETPAERTIPNRGVA